MKKIITSLLTAFFIALPALSADIKTVPSKEAVKPDILKEDIKEDMKQDLEEQVKLFYTTNKSEECQKVLAKIPDKEKSAQVWVIMANLALDNDKQPDAVFYLQKAIELDPKYYKAYYNLGNIHFSNKNYNLAMENYKKSIKYKDDFAYGYYNIGCCYLEKKNYRLARYYIGLAIKRYPDEPLFYYNIAYAYKMLKNPKKAQSALDLYESLMTK